jgi:hypothetical protein
MALRTLIVLFPGIRDWKHPFQHAYKPIPSGSFGLSRAIC